MYWYELPDPHFSRRGERKTNSDSSKVSNDRSSAEEKKGKKRPRGRTQIDTEAKGEVDSQSDTELTANEGTSSSASLSSKKASSPALGVAQRIRKKDKMAPVEPDSSEEENGGDTVGINENDSNLEGFDINVNPDDDKFTLGNSRSVWQRSPPTLNTGVMGISNDRMVNIHLSYTVKQLVRLFIRRPSWVRLSVTFLKIKTGLKSI